MKRSRRKKLSPHVERQLALLDKYYPVNYEERTITLTVHYDKVSDLIDSHFGATNHPFREDALRSIYDTVNSFPIDFRVDIKLLIDDYEGMDSKKILELFHDDMQFNYFSGRRGLVQKWLMFSILLLLGVLMFFFVIYGSAKHWYESESAEIIEKVLDTVGTLFIWEGATILFLNPLRGVQTLAKVLARTKTIAMFEGKTGKMLASEDCKEMVRAWRGGSNLARLSSIALLASACFLIGESITSFTHSLTTCIAGGGTFELMTNTAIMGANSAFKIVAGVMATALFYGRSHLQTPVKVFGWILASIQMSLFLIILFYLFLTWDWQGFFDSVFSIFFSLLFSILYLVGYYLDRKEL